MPFVYNLHINVINDLYINGMKTFVKKGVETKIYTMQDNYTWSES